MNAMSPHDRTPCARAAGPETYSVRSALQPGSATTGLQPAHDETLLSYAQQLTRPRRTLESISRDLCGIAVGMRGMRSAGCFCCHSFVEAPSEATEEVEVDVAHREDGLEERDTLSLREPGEEDAQCEYAAVQAEEVDRALLHHHQRHVVGGKDHRHRRQRRAATSDGAA